MEQWRAKGMATTRLDGILRHLRRAVRSPAGGDNDARLLDLFLRQRDEAAFESLVLRHGPMVFGVCRRVLGNEQDAEDAFQASFLVLVRNAASVRKRGALGAWLYGVAYRTALEARRAMARRRAKEREVVPRVEEADEGGDDLREVLDRELAALPDRYREAVVLCDLEGKGRKEAARELGCPEGTVASRLARGRSLLARRLARYGLAAGAVAAGLSREAWSAGVPAPLVSTTVRAAALFAAGRAATGVVSARVSSLVERVVRAMLVIRLRAMTGVLLLVGVLGAGAGWFCYHGVAAQPNAARGAAAQPAGGERSEQEKVRQELEAVKADLRKALDHVAALEEKLKGMEGGKEEVLFQGKPAAYWVKALKDRDPKYRMEAAGALGEIGKVDRAVLPTLAGALKDDRDDVVREAAVALAGVGKAAVPYMIDALKESGPRGRVEVMNALRGMGGDAEAVVPALRGVLKGSNRDEHAAAALALSGIGPGARAAVPDLMELLKGRDGDGRRTAAYALGAIGRDAKAAVPELIELLKAPDEGTRGAAAQALGGIGPEAKEAVPALIAMLKSRGTVDCWNAAVALGGIGPDAKPAVPALLEVLRNPGPGAGELPRRMFEAIEKIDPETAAKIKRP
jgi:RNA polymerase sigma factor (sigma-70 family)